MEKRIKTLDILLKICIFFTVVSPTLGTISRRYDIEAEAMKLYGEDFKSVLKRFRRTTDYLKILHDKMDEILIYFQEMSLQVLHYYHLKMTKKVADVVGVGRNGLENFIGPTTIRRFYRSFKNRRQEKEDENPDSEQKHKEAVTMLDHYSAFYKELTVPERNSYRDLGFEFAGNLIHTVIQNMGPEEPAFKSTRQPGGGDEHKSSTTTEHPSVHEVTESKETEKETEDTTTTMTSTDTFRFRYRPQGF